MRGHREYRPGEGPPGFAFPLEMIAPVMTALGIDPDIDPEKTKSTLAEIEEACQYFVVQRFLQETAPSAANTRDALRSTGNLAKQLRKEIESLDVITADQLAMRFAETVGRIPLGLGTARLCLDELRAELKAIERAPFLPMPRGRRPDRANQLAVEHLSQVWTRATGRPAKPWIDPAADGNQESGPFADFVRLCFQAIDPDLDPPTLRHYLK